MLKFEGLEIGTKIRAYDFEPFPGRPEYYVEGIIRGLYFEDYKFYRIEVTTDTLGDRKFVDVPMGMLFDFDDRVIVLLNEVEI